jgi:quinol monooxygenase YgiN
MFDGMRYPPQASCGASLQMLFTRAGGLSMQVMISYKVRPDEIERNAELLGDVYEELAAAQPGGLRYATFRLDEQGSFVAFVEFDGQPGTAAHHRLESFQRYRSTLDERCERPPVVTVLHEVGSYGFR